MKKIFAILLALLLSQFAVNAYTGFQTVKSVADMEDGNTVVYGYNGLQNIHLLEPMADIGKDGSMGVSIVSLAGAEEEWNAQLWLMLPEEAPAGTAVSVKFDYKASTNVAASTHAHGEPFNYLTWNAIGDVYFTTEWQTWDKVFIVPNEADGMKSIAFNLSNDKANDVTFYIDNVEISFEKAMGLPEAYESLSEAIARLESELSAVGDNSHPIALESAQDVLAMVKDAFQNNLYDIEQCNEACNLIEETIEDLREGVTIKQEHDQCAAEIEKMRQEVKDFEQMVAEWPNFAPGQADDISRCYVILDEAKEWLDAIYTDRMVPSMMDEPDYMNTYFFGSVKEIISVCNDQLDYLKYIYDRVTVNMEELQTALQKYDSELDQDVKDQAQDILDKTASAHSNKTYDQDGAIAANAEMQRMMATIGRYCLEMDGLQPGALAYMLPDVEVSMKLMKLSGYMNEADVEAMLKMQSLHSLDLQGVTLPDNVISQGMFSSLQKLDYLVLPQEVTTIQNDAISGCNLLTEIEIPASVTTVAEFALRGCNPRLTVKWNTTQAPVPANLFGERETNNFVYAVQGTVSNRRQNVIIGNTALEVLLTDSVATNVPTEFQTQQASYTRDFIKQTHVGRTSGWESIVLPFDVNAIVSEEKGLLAPFGSDVEGAHPFWLAEMTDHGFEYATKIRANVPYIICMPNSEEYAEEFNITGNVTFLSDNVTVRATSDAMPVQGDRLAVTPAYDLVPTADSVYVLNNEPMAGIPAGAVFEQTPTAQAYPFEVYVKPLGAHPVKGECIPLHIEGTTVDAVQRLYADTYGTLDVQVQDGYLLIHSPRRQVIGIYGAGGTLVTTMQLQVGSNRSARLQPGIYVVGHGKYVVK